MVPLAAGVARVIAVALHPGRGHVGRTRHGQQLEEEEEEKKKTELHHVHLRGWVGLSCDCVISYDVEIAKMGGGLLLWK